MIWKDLSYKQVSQIDPHTLVLIPIGTIEAHGGHLPLTTDTLIPQELCLRISKKIKSIIAPEINFGICDSMLKFPGTINVSYQTLFSLLCDYLDSIIGYGFKNVYFINGHGGNESLLTDIVKIYSSKINIKSKDWYDFDFVRQLKTNDKSYQGDHADRLETEMILCSLPKLVDLKQSVDDYFTWPDPDPDEYSGVMRHAVYGYPSLATTKSATNNFLKITALLVKDINNFYDQNEPKQ